jgi:hypothetical protein
MRGWADFRQMGVGWHISRRNPARTRSTYRPFRRPGRSGKSRHPQRQLISPALGRRGGTMERIVLRFGGSKANRSSNQVGDQRGTGHSTDPVQHAGHHCLCALKRRTAFSCSRSSRNRRRADSAGNGSDELACGVEKVAFTLNKLQSDGRKRSGIIQNYR